MWNIKKICINEIFIWILVLVALFFLFKGLHYKFFIEPHVYKLNFQDVDGAIVGSPVRIMGVTVGHVRSLKYLNDEIMAEIYITSKEVKIPEGSRIHVEFSGLGGSKSIEVIPPDKINSKTDKYIIEDPIRVKDIFENNKIYANTLMTLENDVSKMSVEGIYKTTKLLSTDFDFAPIDNSLDNTKAFFQKFSSTVNNLTYSESKAQGTIKKIDDIVSKYKKNPQNGD